MRVLHVLHYCRGGIVTVVLTQITQSRDKNFEYHLAVLENSPELVRYAQSLGVHVHVLGTAPAGLPLRYWQLLRKVRPDIVHTHSYVPRMLTALATLFGGRFGRVSTVHNDYPYFHARNLRSRIKSGSEALFLRAINGLTICGSEQVRAVMQSKYRVSPARLKRIHNGITVSRSDAQHAVEDAGDPIVVTVGRVSEQKNYGLLLDCWSEVSKSVPNARLWIVGDGEQRQQLEAKTRVLGLDTTVEFWGWQPAAEIAGILRRADVFVLSSLHESLPTAMLEAYASGLPVVSTRVAGADEVIVPGVNGYIVDTPAEMVRALQTMLTLPSSERVAMGSRGRDRVLADFTAERYVRQVEQTYRECLA